MPTPNARYNLFTGYTAHIVPNSTPNSRFNLFTGYVANPPVTANSSAARYNVFTGLVASPLVPGGAGTSARFNVFTYPLTAPAPVTSNGGYMLFPISEDPNQRPPTRY